MNAAAPGIPPVISPATPRAHLHVAPGFWTALQGMWRLTWRANCASRRLGISFLALLALPLLAYLSAMPLRMGSNDVIGDPARDFRNLSRTLSRKGARLNEQQHAGISAVFDEEYGRAHANAPSLPPGNSNPMELASRQLDQLNEWNRRLVERVEEKLEPKQMEPFRNFQRAGYNVRAQDVNRPHWNASEAFYHLLIDFYFFLVLPLVCVRSCGALFRDELQADTLGFLTTRPVPRASLVVVKYISQTAWLMALLLAQTLLLLAAGAWSGAPGLASASWVLLGAQLLAVPAWSALGLLLGLLTNRYIAVALVYGFVVELGIGRIPTNINTLSLMRHLQALLANNPTLQDHFQWSNHGVWEPIGALLLGTAIFLGAAAALFTYREYHHNAEMQK